MADQMTAYAPDYLNYVDWPGNQLLAQMVGSDTEIRGTDPATYAAYVAGTQPFSVPSVRSRFNSLQDPAQIPGFNETGSFQLPEAVKSAASGLVNIDLGINWEELITRGGLILLAVVVVAIGIFSLR